MRRVSGNGEVVEYKPGIEWQSGAPERVCRHARLPTGRAALRHCIRVARLVHGELANRPSLPRRNSPARPATRKHGATGAGRPCLRTKVMQVVCHLHILPRGAFEPPAEPAPRCEPGQAHRRRPFVRSGHRVAAAEACRPQTAGKLVSTIIFAGPTIIFTCSIFVLLWPQDHCHVQLVQVVSRPGPSSTRK